MRTALADPTFNLPPLPSVKDQTSQKAAADQMQLNQKMPTILSFLEMKLRTRASERSRISKQRKSSWPL